MVGVCDGGNRYAPHRLMCLNTWPMGNGTIRRNGLVGVDVLCWRKCVTMGVGFEVSKAQATPSVEHSLLVLPWIQK